MSKALERLSLALAAVSLCAASASAQTTLEWIVLSPAGEEFTARVPAEPLRVEQEVRAGEFAAAGRRYTATAEGGARYVVWSLRDAGMVGERLRPLSHEGWASGGESRYLDLIAEAAWELLVRPEFERAAERQKREGKSGSFYPSMSLSRQFELGGRPAREYAVKLKREGGPVYVCSGGGRVYVVAALSADPNAADSRRFVESFGLNGLPPQTAAPPAPGFKEMPFPRKGGAPGEDEGPFKVNEVTKRALITHKPEPGFTEEARKFNVTGVVRLRAVLSKTGEVADITVFKHLPHGLTEKSMDAARLMRFEPAQKDGRAVSQYVVLEYNFNIY